MTVKVDHAAGCCQIWVNQSENHTYAQSVEYQQTVRRYRAMGYRISIFLDKTETVLPDIAARSDLRWQGFF